MFNINIELFIIYFTGFYTQQYLQFNVNIYFNELKNLKKKVSKAYFFFLCLFALALFLRLCVEILALFLFLPLGIIKGCFYVNNYVVPTLL